MSEKNIFSIFPLISVLSFFLVACSHIDEDERLIYEKPEAAMRTVLLEDFTGQRCVNCPKGTAVIHQLETDFGDAVVAVGIYSGSFGKTVAGKLLPLTTETGNEYFDHWKLNEQPVGMVNRHGAVNYTNWTRDVKEELTKTAPLTIALTAEAKNGVIDITLNESGTDGTVTGKLQVWVVEDSIIATQTRHDPIDNDNVTINDQSYVHNHVFRTTVNGIWGEDFTIGEGETKTQTMTQTIDDAWKVEHLSIVAFVYNSSGVQQAAKTKLVCQTTN